MCAAYYRGAMGILLVYDVTDEQSFNNIRNWMRNIEQHASETVNKARPATAVYNVLSRSSPPSSLVLDCDTTDCSLGNKAVFRKLPFPRPHVARHWC